MSPDAITALFAEAANAFTPIQGNPTDDDLTAIREILTPLLFDIPYDETGPTPGRPNVHNLIGLIEPDAAYIAEWNEAFPRPARPAPYDPTIAADATAVTRNRMEAKHSVKLADYATYETTERALSKFIRDIIDEIWYKDLRHARTFYNKVTARELLEHLDANCGGLHPSELINLNTEMMGYYATTEGIPEYINSLEDAQRKLRRANLPMDDANLVAMASTAVLASQHFPRTTDEWEALPIANKTWAEWKIRYRAAHIARKRQLLASGGTDPFHGAHAATESTGISTNELDKLDGYLDNLANAATRESSTLRDLADANACNAASIKGITASIAQLTAAYYKLAGKKPPTAPPATERNNKRNYQVGGYCWTHGYKVGLKHTSATCKSQDDGHKEAATRANTMGGSSNNKGWDD